VTAKFSTGFRNALIDGGDISALFDGGELHIYSGTQPADADTTEGAGTLLAIVALPGTSAFAASAVSGSIAKNGTWTSDAGGIDVSGTAAWFRMYDAAITTGASTTAVRIDGAVGTAAADLNLNTLTLVATDPITVDTFSISLTA